VRASKPFLDLVRMALLNRAPERFDLAYRLLWRLQSQPRAAQDAADPLVRRLDQLSRPVRRDIHKMRASCAFAAWPKLTDRSASLPGSSPIITSCAPTPAFSCGALPRCAGRS
jgi:hypothetical protein